jgi:hypothetical protein
LERRWGGWRRGWGAFFSFLARVERTLITNVRTAGRLFWEMSRVRRRG